MTINTHDAITVDFGEVKTAPIECIEKYFQMMSSAYLQYSKATQNVLTLMIHLRKRSARFWLHFKSGLEQDFDDLQ